MQRDSDAALYMNYIAKTARPHEQETLHASGVFGSHSNDLFLQRPTATTMHNACFIAAMRLGLERYRNRLEIIHFKCGEDFTRLSRWNTSQHIVGSTVSTDTADRLPERPSREWPIKHGEIVQSRRGTVFWQLEHHALDERLNEFYVSCTAL